MCGDADWSRRIACSDLKAGDLMNCENSDPVVAEMVDRIARGFTPERILLFGSRARGEIGRWSDVDLLVVMPDGTDRREAAVAMRCAVGDLLVPKDIVVTTPDQIARRGHIIGTVLRPALREGIVLYERE